MYGNFCNSGASQVDTWGFEKGQFEPRLPTPPVIAPPTLSEANRVDIFVLHSMESYLAQLLHFFGQNF